MSPILRLARLILSDPDRAKAEAQRISEQAQAKRRRVLAKSRPRRRKRDESKVTKARRRSEVRRACEIRSGGACENCRRFSGASLHMDHFWGRSREESIESCWMLCPRCDLDKTVNHPERRQWIDLFRGHCMKHGYQAQIVKANRAIALENAQHPANGDQS